MLRLVFSRRLGPLFTTQFLGAFNDNLFKNTVGLAFIFSSGDETTASQWASIVAGLFILPFWLISPFAGQLCDKYDKAKVMQWVKVSEIAIMVVAWIGFIYSLESVLLGLVFFMGVHSSFFGPAKYAILPEHLNTKEVVTGNGLIGMSTFIAIILGTLVSGIARDFGGDALPRIGIAAIVIAILGTIAARFIPSAPSHHKDMKIVLHPLESMRQLLQVSRQSPSIHQSIIGNSWFWLLCAILLAQVPAYTKFTLNGDATLASLLLVAFVVGISLGSIVCVVLSRGDVELGLVPIGALGISLIGIHFWYLNTTLGVQDPITAYEFFVSKLSMTHAVIVLDLVLLAVFAAFFQIPIFALIQTRATPETRSQVIAANNVINAMYMVIGTVIATTLTSMFSFSINDLFLTVFLANFLIASYIFVIIPEFFMRFVVWLLASTIYKIDYEGRSHIPERGGALIVANHISFIDWFVMTAACRRPVRFVMDHTIFRIPVLRIVFRTSKAIPIAPAKLDPKCKEEAFAEISHALRTGHLVCIFPEGKISTDGEIDQFKRGVEEILKRDPVPVIPVGLNGLWGSFFSKSGKGAMKKVPTPSHRHIILKIGPALAPSLTADDYREAVHALVHIP